MSDNRNYYYLKLKDHFFDSDEILYLESLPDGYKYSNILLKLYLRSLKNDGKLLLNDVIPYNPELLATVTRHSVGDIKQALTLFSKLGLVEKLDNGTIYMLQIQNFIGKSSTEGDRKREYRKKIIQEKNKQSSTKLLGQTNGHMSDNITGQTSTNQGQMSERTSEQMSDTRNVSKSVKTDKTQQYQGFEQTSDKRPPEIDIEIDKELDIELEREIERDIDKETDKTSYSSNSFFPAKEKNMCLAWLGRYLLDDKTSNQVLGEIKKKGKDSFYLREKLLYVAKKGPVSENVGLLIKAIREDYR